MRREQTFLVALWVAAVMVHVCAAQEPDAKEGRSATRLTNSVNMKLALIPAGEFVMGAPDSDQDAAKDEKSQHRVRERSEIVWPLECQEYGTLEFGIRDPDGYILAFDEDSST